MAENRQRKIALWNPQRHPNRAVWVAALIGAVIIGLSVTLVQSNQQHTIRGQSQLMHKRGGQINQYDPQGFLRWQITKKPIGNGKTRISGVVIWNAKSGADGEPVIGMPVELYLADPNQRKLTQLSSTMTDKMGRFTIDTDSDQKTMLGGKISGAWNIPPQVWTTLESGQRPQAEIQRVKQLQALEVQINEQTAWGRRVTDWLEKQGTRVVVDPTRLAAAHYSIIDDTILYNPQQDQTLAEKIADLRRGYLNGFILRFHEEIHRAQENKSKWGELWRFLRKTNQMDKYFHRRAEAAKNTNLYASHNQWIHLDRVLTGNHPSNGIQAAHHFAQWRMEMIQTKPQRRLLKEICAYWISDTLTVDELYHQIYERDLHGIYADHHRVSKARFAELCKTIDNLYAAFDGDFDALARFVGNADSIADFQTQAKAVNPSVPDQILKQRRDQMSKEKREWKKTTQRLARQILGQSATEFESTNHKVSAP